VGLTVRTHTAIIGELTHELDRGLIYEATLITDDGAHLLGMCNQENQHITIDPKVAIVSTLLHELIHRRYPTWSERRVRREEKRALQQLSPKDIQTWYRRYKRMVRKRRPVDAIEYEG
jgi:hypothetical protein